MDFKKSLPLLMLLFLGGSFWGFPAQQARSNRTRYYLSRPADQVCEPAGRIMPLGDSITRGTGTTPATGYRQPLYLALTAAGYNVDFVGSRQAGETAEPDFDADYEGQSGVTDDDIAANVYAWLQVNPADVVLLHIGTNDMDAGRYDPGAADIEHILDEIDRYSPAVTVVLARIINRKTPNPETTQFNIDVAGMAQARIAAGDKIILVNQEAALTYPADMVDEEHPHSTGYAKMANVWFDALASFLPLCPSGTLTPSPSPSSTATPLPPMTPVTPSPLPPPYPAPLHNAIYFPMIFKPL